MSNGCSECDTFTAEGFRRCKHCPTCRKEGELKEKINPDSSKTYGPSWDSYPPHYEFHCDDCENTWNVFLIDGP